MDRRLRRAVRGLTAGVAGLSILLAWLLPTFGVRSLRLTAAFAAVGVGALVAAVGRSGLRRLLGRPPRHEEGEPVDDRDGVNEWWLARLEPALDDAWNDWSDAVLATGFGVLGVGSFLAIAVAPGEPPLELVIVGFVAINCSLLSLAFVFK